MKNIRTCIACRQKFDKTKHKFIKITINNGKMKINQNNEVFGRSCYVCEDENCIKKVIKNKLINKVYKRNINEDIYEKLNSYKGLYGN